MEESKFNFEGDEDSNASEQSVNLKQEAKGFLNNLIAFVSNVFNFRKDTDTEETIDAIKRDIPFKGATAWILICSIFVASVGLNANSTAVVIGAMLISPLMGPILGIGMSIAINDIFTLRKSLINFAIMVVLSVLTAFLFFWLFPLSEVTSELFARTRPDIRDVLIAFFGGLALIIARTKKGTIASVIFGVAIATALMPPLCTAGFGLAKGNWPYFFGAMYLFLINTIFIGLATFLVLKILGFPMLHYANSKKRKRISNLASLLAIVVMIPAVWTFISVLNETNFTRDAKAFVDTELEGLPHADFVKKNAVVAYFEDGGSRIELNTFGLDEIPDEAIALLRERLKSYKNLTETELIVNQNKYKNIDNLKYMEQLRYRDSVDLLSQSQKINFLEDELRKKERYERNQIPLDKFAEELSINYNSIEKVAFSNFISTDFKKIDTIAVLSVKWKSNVSSDDIFIQRKNLERWLKVKYKLDSVVVKSM
ncbi:DUF389 domain-containing protein [Paucihalobacter sp.]|uniref:DUF389 domain-containing protein n=1 Tax=Paucihalobacter sp. TaxID=2850405 RepID=UPI002FE2409F